MNLRVICYIAAAYLSGSVLFAEVAGTLFGKRELLQLSKDKNPGTVNAFKYCGFWCGILTLAGDLAKGFLPVYLYLQTAAPDQRWALPLVMAAPVMGHILPIFHRFHGGKGIATTFGVMLGLYPYDTPLMLFAAVFVLLSVVLRVDPTFYRTVIAYLLTLAAMVIVKAAKPILLGFALITAAVCLRLHRSDETREDLEIKLLWTH